MGTDQKGGRRGGVAASDCCSDAAHRRRRTTAAGYANLGTNRDFEGRSGRERSDESEDGGVLSAGEELRHNWMIALLLLTSSQGGRPSDISDTGSALRELQYPGGTGTGGEGAGHGGSEGCESRQVDGCLSESTESKKRPAVAV